LSPELLRLRCTHPRLLSEAFILDADYAYSRDGDGCKVTIRLPSEAAA
jgi:hypothetical protein